MANVAPNKVAFKNYGENYVGLTERLTGYSLFSQLTDGEGDGVSSTEPIALNGRLSMTIKLIIDYDGLHHMCTDDFGEITHSSSKPTDEHIKIEDDRWILPEYPIQERYETIRANGVAKHDALLIAKNWANESIELLRELENDDAYYYGFNVEIKDNVTGKSVYENSCFGYIYSNSRYGKLDHQDVMDSEIEYFLSEWKKQNAKYAMFSNFQKLGKIAA